MKVGFDQPQPMNYATYFDYGDRGGMFVMRHKVHSMLTQSPGNTFASNNIWFVDFRASNHMTSHKDWFKELRKTDRLRYVETGDATIHPIQHVGNVLFENDDKQTYIKKDLHVPTIMKNLVLFGQMVEQRMQVRFNQEGCFIVKDG